ncbi:MAG: glycosyltransferase [Candidatus Binatia bacterium]
MKSISKPSIQLVLTVALKEELPLDWLASLDVEIFTLKALKAGAWKGPSQNKSSKKSVLFIISGVGAAAARETALWIQKNLQPLFVVNLGTVGAIHSEDNIGEWVAPQLASNERGEALPVDGRTPFPWAESVPRRFGGTLLSVEKPQFGNLPPEWMRFHYLDMECFAQAKVFAETCTSFHAVKWISDFSNPNGKEQFQRNLSRFRREVKRVLTFLRQDGKPEISVIIPVHNRRRWIGPCVDSVLEQTLRPKEIIVVDDDSEDGTLKALAPYKDRLTVLAQSENRGVAAARNRGIAQSSSPWVCFLDSDDLWHKDKLNRQWQFFQAHPFYEILQCDEIWIRNGRRVNPCKHHEKPQGWIWKPSLARCLVSPSAVMMRRTLVERMGGFDEDLPVCEDYDLWIRIAREHVVGLDPSLSVIKHGGHEGQLSRRYTAMDSFRVKALLKALKEEKDPRHRTELIRVLKEKLAVLLKGSNKRMKFEKCREYEAILSSLEGVKETG